MSRSPRSAVLAGTLAGLVWGLAFLVPVLLGQWSPVAVTVGRYLTYGLVSLVLMLASGSAARLVARRHWGVALQFALTGNVAYYLLLVLGIAWAGGPVTDIVIGCIPIVMAIIGNMISRRYRWRSLILPVALVCVGLALVNAVAMGSAASSASSVKSHPPAVFTLGVLCSFAAVGLWTWYGLANAAFVQRHPEVGAATWSAVVGVGTGLVTLLALPLAVATGQMGIPHDDAGEPSTVVAFVAGSVLLGVVVSWAATTLWNSASSRMSTTAAGMLINVETVSGYIYLYAAARHWPPAGELAGFALILLGVILVVRLPASMEDSVGTIRTVPEQPSRQR